MANTMASNAPQFIISHLQAGLDPRVQRQQHPCFCTSGKQMAAIMALTRIFIPLYLTIVFWLISMVERLHSAVNAGFSTSALVMFSCMTLSISSAPCALATAILRFPLRSDKVWASATQLSMMAGWSVWMSMVSAMAPMTPVCRTTFSSASAARARSAEHALSCKSISSRSDVRAVIMNPIPPCWVIRVLISLSMDNSASAVHASACSSGFDGW
mmetsp:Transcript_25858/g.52892  ORF Transcript_25858/g.52892 Transcript_25858/m.52892 type:complete len:214 (+) Transcript_25858:1021-1662(+)